MLRWPLVLLVLLLFASPALACSCGGPESPCRVFEEIDVAFVGKVEKEDFREGTAYFTFSVREILKGVPPLAVKVWTTTGGASCGFDFQVGETYLVFAYQHEDGELGTNTCTKTQHIRQAVALLPQLRSFSARRLTAPLFGTLMAFSRTTSGGDTEIGALAGRRISAVGPEGITTATVTDTNGAFEFSTLPPGRHALLVDLPDRWTLLWAQPLKVETGINSCTELFLRAYPDGVIAGRILDSDGKPARGYARLVDGNFQPTTAQRFDYGLLTDLDADGSFWFGRLSPGRYKLFHIDRGPYQPGVVATFFPGVPNLTEAKEIELMQGNHVENMVFQLPQR